MTFENNNHIKETSALYIKVYGEQAFLKATNKMISYTALNQDADRLFWQKVCDHIDDQQNANFLMTS